ncbi:MAG: hypothetical protein SPE11_10810 [Parabacteroides sp.]|nr:hypothetical protein [Parabacteroides sp.]MDY4528381.1 hypothetical protein [Parabacteroides sp.]
MDIRERLSCVRKPKLKKTSEPDRLRVFYGWCRKNKIRKKEAISVIFENERGRDDRTQRFVNRMQETVYVRFQTPDEVRDAEGSIRMFSEYLIFMHDPKIRNSLNSALAANFEADRNQVGTQEREQIRTQLRNAYLSAYPDYHEPNYQMELPFSEAENA